MPGKPAATDDNVLRLSKSSLSVPLIDMYFAPLLPQSFNATIYRDERVMDGEAARNRLHASRLENRALTYFIFSQPGLLSMYK